MTLISCHQPLPKSHKIYIPHAANVDLLSWQSVGNVSVGRIHLCTQLSYGQRSCDIVVHPNIWHHIYVSWMFEYSWMGMVGRCRLLHTPQPDFCLIKGVSLHLPRCKTCIMVRQAIESHHVFVLFQIWSPNQKFLWLLFQNTWHIPWSIRNPTCGKLPSTLRRSTSPRCLVSLTRLPTALAITALQAAVQTLLSAWNDLDNTPPQRNWSMSKAMTIQNTPPPCGEALSNLGMLDDERISISSCLGGSCPRIECLLESHPLRFCECCWVSGLPPILSLLLPTFEMLQDLLDAFFSHLNPIHFHPSSTISHLSLTQKNL